MEEKKNARLTQKVGKQTFIINMKPAEDAKLSCEELVKDLVTKDSMQLEETDS